MGHCAELERSRRPSQTILINCVVVKCQKSFVTLLQIWFSKWDISAAQQILKLSETPTTEHSVAKLCVLTVRTEKFVQNS